MSSLSGIVTLIGSSGAALLADTSLKSAALLLSVAIATRVLRSASAAVRHRIWSLGLGGALLMPLVSLAVPQVQVPGVTRAFHLAGMASVSEGIPVVKSGVGENNQSTFKWKADREAHPVAAELTRTSASAPAVDGPARKWSAETGSHTSAER